MRNLFVAFVILLTLQTEAFAVERLLLKWSLQQLALAARLPLNTVMRAELLDRASVGTAVHATALRKALAAAGVNFGEPGVRLRETEP